MIKGLTNTFRNALGRALNIPGDLFTAEVKQGIQPVIVAEELTDQRSLYARGGLSWAAGVAELGISGAAYPVITLDRKAAALKANQVQRLLRIRRITLWSSAAVPSWVGIRIFNAGFQPVVTSATVIDPNPCDGRQATAGVSAYALVTGLSLTGPTLGADGWDVVWVPPTQYAAPFSFDPRITMRYGDVLFIAGFQESTKFGGSINWEEYPATGPEFQGEAPIPGSI